MDALPWLIIGVLNELSNPSEKSSPFIGNILNISNLMNFLTLMA